MYVLPTQNSKPNRRFFGVAWVLAAIAVASIAMTVLSTPASAAGCATSKTRLSLSVAWPGVAVGVDTQLHNCSARKERYTVERTFTSACGTVILINRNVVRFDPLGYLTVVDNWVVPKDTCLGAGVVTSRTFDGTTLLATSSAPLDIQVHP